MNAARRNVPADADMAETDDDPREHERRAEPRPANLFERTGKLELRVDRIEDDARRASRYTHVMLEDLTQRFSKLETAGVRFETSLNHMSTTDTEAGKRLGDIESRLRSLERLAWSAIGGMAAVTGVMSFLGWQAIKLLVR